MSLPLTLTLLPTLLLTKLILPQVAKVVQELMLAALELMLPAVVLRGMPAVQMVLPELMLLVQVMLLMLPVAELPRVLRVLAQPAVAAALLLLLLAIHLADW
jgi:hypothetical protein